MSFTDDLSNFGFGAANSLLNTGIGLALEGHNDRRQLEQQYKLQAQQMQGQKHMTDYNMQKQLELWKATNYGAQMEQLKAAGLNPGLIYGMSGGGGQTANLAQGQVSGGEAPKGGHEVIDMQGMGMQMALLQAQKRVLETQADKNAAEAQKTSGIDTAGVKQSITESQTRVDSLLQGIDNARQQHEIQKLEITLKNIENYEKQATQSDRMDYIEYQTKIAMKQLDNVTAEAFINKSTVQQKIDIIRAEAIGAILKNELTKTQTGIGKTQTEY